MIRLAVMLAACVLAASAAGPALAEHSGVPEWVKETASAWAAGDISDDEYVAAIEFLVAEGVISASPAYEAPDSLTIGFIPSEKADAVTSKATALKDYLQPFFPETEIEVIVPTGYEPIIEGMRFGHIDAAFMDSGPAWIAHERSGAEVVLAEVVDGKTSYHATVWARTGDSSVSELSDVVGKRVAFTSMTGSSGFITPIGTLIKDGVIPLEGSGIIALEKSLDGAFESHAFAGGYKAALQMLINENADVAFGSDIAATKYLDPEDQARVNPVASLGRVPSHPFVVSSDMSPGVRNILVDALVDLNYAENNKILSDLYGADALLPTDTETHLGEFGLRLDALTGLDELVLDKYNKAK